jgi:uncharacterized membrane protein
VQTETLFAEYCHKMFGWEYVHEELTMHTGHEYYAYDNEEEFFYFPMAQVYDQVRELIDKGSTRIVKYIPGE